MKAILKTIPLLSCVNENLLDTLIRENKIYERTYKKNSTIHAQGKRCDTIDIICSGSLAAYSLSSNGSQSVVFDFKIGDIIGANLLFGSNNCYPMNIYCTADCLLLHISKEAVCELLKDYNFVMKYIQSISANSQGMNKKIAMYTQKNLHENLMDYFSALAAEQKSSIIVLPITKKQLADYLGVQRPSLFRELKKLKDEGFIEIKNKIVSINQNTCRK